MKQNPFENSRLLAISISSRGFGFIIIEGERTLVDWGVKEVKSDKNAQSLKRVEKLIDLYQPRVIVLENVSSKTSRRAPRIRALTQEIINTARVRRVRSKLFSRTRLLKTFLPVGERTKQALAETVAKRFPEELASQVPSKRKLWMSENPRMSIFEAAALAVMFQLRQKR